MCRWTPHIHSIIPIICCKRPQGCRTTKIHQPKPKISHQNSCRRLISVEKSLSDWISQSVLKTQRQHTSTTGFGFLTSRRQRVIHAANHKIHFEYKKQDESRTRFYHRLLHYSSLFIFVIFWTDGEERSSAAAAATKHLSYKNRHASILIGWTNKRIKWRTTNPHKSLKPFRLRFMLLRNFFPIFRACFAFFCVYSA